MGIWRVRTRISEPETNSRWQRMRHSVADHSFIDSSPPVSQFVFVSRRRYSKSLLPFCVFSFSMGYLFVKNSDVLPLFCRSPGKAGAEVHQKRR